MTHKFLGNTYKHVTFFLAAAVALLSIMAVSSCGGPDGATVTMKNLAFEPDAVTIKKGRTVTWQNDDRRIRQIMSGEPPVMTDDFMSPPLDPGQSWSFTFNTTGEFPFHDMKIPGIVGRVIVEE